MEIKTNAKEEVEITVSKETTLRMIYHMSSTISCRDKTLIALTNEMAEAVGGWSVYNKWIDGYEAKR